MKLLYYAVRNLFLLAVQNVGLSLKYVGVLAGASLLCMFLLFIATRPESFNAYNDAFQIAFAITCASMLIGLLLSIGLICEDYIMIRRELRMGISPASIIMAKTLNIIFFCLIISSIIIFPYFFNAFRIDGQNTLYLYFGVFFTMLASAELGLFISTFWRNRPQIASLFVSIIMLFQILFSGFLFTSARLDLSRLTISNYSIRAIGSGLRFDREAFRGYTEHRAFEVSWEHAINNIGHLFIVFVVFLILSIIILYVVEKFGLDIKLRPE